MVIEGRFKGKKAIITGASSGIGRATAIRFAKEGGTPTLISLSISGLEEVAKIITLIKGFNYQPSWGSMGFEIWRNFDGELFRNRETRNFPAPPFIEMTPSAFIWSIRK